MADDLKDRGPRDRSKINLREDWEVAWWTKKFGVSVEQLRDAVVRVGNSADKVAARLGKNAA